MRCPFCGHDDTQVKDSRPSEDNSAIRRRRHCPECGGRFTTFERVQLREITVIKRSGRRVPFDRLLSRCAAGDAQVRYEQARLTSVVAYATPLLQRPTGPPGVPQGLTMLVQTTATQAGQELTPYVAGVSTVAVLPWHPNLADARTTCATLAKKAS